MDKDLSFEVDIFDKAAIKTRLPELAKVIEARKNELRELEERYDQLRRWAGLRDGAAPRTRAEMRKAAMEKRSIEDEAVEIVNRSGRPMTTMEVFVEIDRITTTKTVNWSLWSAEQAGRLKKAGRGRYAPLDYNPDQDGLLTPDGEEAKGKELSAPVAGDGS